MTVEERLASIDSKIAALNQRLTDHTAQDETNFSRLSEQVGSLDGKITQLLLREARREGEYTGIRRSAIILASAVSMIISATGVAVAVYIN